MDAVQAGIWRGASASATEGSTAPQRPTGGTRTRSRHHTRGACRRRRTSPGGPASAGGRFAGGCSGDCWGRRRKPWRASQLHRIAGPRGLGRALRWIARSSSPCYARRMPILRASRATCPFADCPSSNGHAPPKIHGHASHRTRCGSRRRRRCMVCSRTFSATTGTAYARNRRPKADFDRVVEMHSEGMTKAAIARVVKVSPGTVARWCHSSGYQSHPQLGQAVPRPPVGRGLRSAKRSHRRFAQAVPLSRPEMSSV